MKKIATINSLKVLAFVITLTALHCSINAQTLKADYQFQGVLTSSVGTAPAMSQIGGLNTFESDRVDGYTRQTMRFPANGGLSVNTTGLIPTNAYTVVILFRFDNVTGIRRRVFDAKQGTSNACGMYIANSQLEPEPTSVTNIYPNTYVQVVISREANGTIRFARDGFLVNLSDFNASCYVNDGNNLRFFADDSVVGNEVSAGNVARIRLYDGSMTAAQMRALDRPANATGGGDQNILFSTTRHNLPEIYSMNSDGTNERRLTNNAVADYGARWSPDKSKIVFVRDDVGTIPEQIWIMNADGSGQTRLTNTTTNDHAPSFKPDGSKIVFSRCDANFSNCDIFTMNPDGTNQQVFNGAGTAGEDEDLASYSPDGSKIVYTRINPDPAIPTSGLYSLTETTIINRLSSPALPIGDRDARFSPDGTKVIFTRYPDILNGTNIDGVEIYRMNANGTGQTNITLNSVFDDLPVWSQDSTTIAFRSRRDTPEVTEIYTMNALTAAGAIRLTFNSVSDAISDFYTIPSPVSSLTTPFDYDGDGKSDPSVFRASNGTWYVSRSGLGDMYVMPWGLAGDNIVPADYDGDGKTDLAVRRPTDNNFYIFNSSNSTMEVRNFGITGDVALPSDYNGDGKADVAVWRPSNGTWYLSLSGSGIFYVMPWGLAADKPVPGDFDGDGKTDLAVFRPTEGRWYIFNTVTGAFSTNDFGVNGDQPVQADYSGDGKTDFAVYRPSNNTWYRQHTNDGTFNVSQWGLPGDFPVPGDYDGDGKTDVAVWRPSNGTWYVLKSTSGVFTQSFGTSGDIPTPNAFVY